MGQARTETQAQSHPRRDGSVSEAEPREPAIERRDRIGDMPLDLSDGQPARVRDPRIGPAVEPVQHEDVARRGVHVRRHLLHRREQGRDRRPIRLVVLARRMPPFPATRSPGSSGRARGASAVPRLVDGRTRRTATQ